MSSEHVDDKESERLTKLFLDVIQTITDKKLPGQVTFKPVASATDSKLGQFHESFAFSPKRGITAEYEAGVERLVHRAFRAVLETAMPYFCKRDKTFADSKLYHHCSMTVYSDQSYKVSFNLRWHNEMNEASDFYGKLGKEFAITKSA